MRVGQRAAVKDISNTVAYKERGFFLSHVQSWVGKFFSPELPTEYIDPNQNAGSDVLTVYRASYTKFRVASPVVSLSCERRCTRTCTVSTF